MQSPGGGGQSENGASAIVQSGAYAPLSPAAGGSRGGATAATPPTEHRAKRQREAAADSSEMPPLVERNGITAAKAVQEYLKLQPVSKQEIVTKWGVSQGAFNRALDKAESTGAADAIKREEQSILAARAISEGGGGAKKAHGRREEVAPEDRLYKDTCVTQSKYKQAHAYASSLVKPADGSEDGLRMIKMVSEATCEFYANKTSQRATGVSGSFAYGHSLIAPAFIFADR